MEDQRAGIVLSGGGALGAYEVGVLQGIVDVLGLGEGGPAPFQVFAGTSVGAINATFLAAHADRGDHGVGDLAARWRALRMPSSAFVVPDVLGWLRSRAFGARGNEASEDSSEAGSLEELVRDVVPFDRLHANVASGRAKAVMVAAQHIASGRTHVFAELSPDTHYVPSRDPQRVTRFEALSADHLLASSAVPFLFPVRRVHGAWFCDGAIKLNTPLAAAVRAGASKLLVISLALLELDEKAELDPGEEEAAPASTELLSRLLASVTVDPVGSDLLALERLNRVVRTLEQRLDAEALVRFHQAVRDARGAPYRAVDTLVFRASRELAEAGAEHLEAVASHSQYGSLIDWLVSREPGAAPGAAATMLAFLLFDGEFAGRLIELGREAAHARAAELEAFFA